jgi:hypothetical protein
MKEMLLLDLCMMFLMFSPLLPISLATSDSGTVMLIELCLGLRGESRLGESRLGDFLSGLLRFSLVSKIRKASILALRPPVKKMSRFSKYPSDQMSTSPTLSLTSLSKPDFSLLEKHKWLSLSTTSLKVSENS